MSGNEIFYPKVTERVSNTAEQIADLASFNALSTGVLKGMHAAKNSRKSVCIGDKPLAECDAAKQAMRSTMELLPDDSNDGFTGWVGYERANSSCDDCNSGCSARVFWQDGIPTELTKYLFHKKFEPDTVITINLPSC